MRIERPRSFIAEQTSVANLRSQYLDNSYLILKERVDKNYDIINIPFSSCRDNFLVNVHSLFANGEEELLIGLPLPENWLEKVNARHKRTDKLTKKDVIALLATVFHSNPWRVYNKFLGTSNQLIFEIKTIDFWGVANIEVLLFKIYNQTYIDPTLFWLLTHELRKYLTGLSRTDTTIPEYNTDIYLKFVNNLKSGAYILFKDKYTYKSPSNATVLSYHSPLNLLCAPLSFYIRFNSLISLIEGYKHARNSEERKNLIEYEISHLKSAFTSIQGFHVNLNLPSIQTTVGALKIDVLSKLLKLIEEAQ